MWTWCSLLRRLLIIDSFSFLLKYIFILHIIMYNWVVIASLFLLNLFIKFLMLECLKALSLRLCLHYVWSFFLTSFTPMAVNAKDWCLWMCVLRAGHVIQALKFGIFNYLLTFQLESLSYFSSIGGIFTLCFDLHFPSSPLFHLRYHNY